MQYMHKTKHIFNMSDDNFWLLVKDLSKWAHKVKVVECGEMVFQKDAPIWRKGMFKSGKDMRHYLKLQRTKGYVPLRPRLHSRV